MSAEDLKDRRFPTQDGASPMMAQFLTLREEAPKDALLFYRMGDFYELFFQDAEIASRALGIVLTKRGKHAGDDIPMCGVPVERSDDYLHRLIAQGHRVITPRLVLQDGPLAEPRAVGHAGDTPAGGDVGGERGRRDAGAQAAARP